MTFQRKAYVHFLNEVTQILTYWLLLPLISSYHMVFPIQFCDFTFSRYRPGHFNKLSLKCLNHLCCVRLKFYSNEKQFW